jgi:hypothetical protein
MRLGMMLSRIHALYNRRVGILAFPVIILICGFTVGAVRYPISSSITFEDNNLTSTVGVRPESTKGNAYNAVSLRFWINWEPVCRLLKPTICRYWYRLLEIIVCPNTLLEIKRLIGSHLLDVAGSFGALFLYDAIIFGMTLYKTLAHRRGEGFGLFIMLMRDGMSNR